MTTEERIKLAREKLERVLDALNTLLFLRANNDVVLRSDVLRKQVAPSYAANAYNIFQGAMYDSEVVRVCAVWDPVLRDQQAIDRDSLPAVMWLLDEATIEVLAQEREEDRKKRIPRLLEAMGSKIEREDIKKLIRKNQERDAAAEAEKVRQRWAEAKDLVSAVLGSAEYQELKSYRDKHLAHALVQTTDEKKGKVCAPPKYGHESTLFEKSLETFDRLFYVAKDACFIWSVGRENAERCANALWSICQLNIVE